MGVTCAGRGVLSGPFRRRVPPWPGPAAPCHGLGDDRQQGRSASFEEACHRDAAGPFGAGRHGVAAAKVACRGQATGPAGGAGRSLPVPRDASRRCWGRTRLLWRDATWWNQRER
ncbi:hypothetical protein [Brachybacterium sacelli]|uniref:hypothetical protein n=1 Tax=Brachybacterium sacelli TaxID=173364 RepID=UPI00360F17DB